MSSERSVGGVTILALGAVVLMVLVLVVQALLPPGAVSQSTLLGTVASIGAVVGGVVGVCLAIEYPELGVRVHDAVVDHVERRWGAAGEDRGVTAARGLAGLSALYVAGFAGLYGIDRYVRANWPRWTWASDACPEPGMVCGQVPPVVVLPLLGVGITVAGVWWFTSGKEGEEEEVVSDV